MKTSTIVTTVLIIGTLLTSAVVSYVTCRISTPAVAAFNMKGTVDAFFDSVGRKSLDEAQSKALSERFNNALEASLRDWQIRHDGLILVAPAVVQGAPDITREIQRDVARRMKDAP